jgi:hypothetical protein
MPDPDPAAPVPEQPAPARSGRRITPLRLSAILAGTIVAYVLSPIPLAWYCNHYRDSRFPDCMDVIYWPFIALYDTALFRPPLKAYGEFLERL